LRGVGDELERQQGGTVRSDREMSVAMLHDEVSDRIEEIARVHETGYTRARMALDQALGHPPEGSPTPYDVTLIPSLTVDENEVAGERFLVKEDDLTKRLAMTGRQNQGQIYALQTSLDSFWVEIHKKFAISFACIVFVLMGAPLAIRFPRGGVGMVIAVSVGIFAVYWAGLIGGENLADKGVVTPFLAMWAPDLAFLALGLFLALRMGKSTGANRGGGLDEVLFAVGDFARRLMRPRRASA